jgi:hypothetical protein
MPSGETQRGGNVRKKTLAGVLGLLVLGLIGTAVLFIRVVMDNLAEEQAIVAVERMGGRYFLVANKPILPKWFAWAWPLPSAKVWQVRLFEDATVDDDGIKKLAAFRQLEVLGLDSKQMTEGRLNALGCLKQLKCLGLTDTTPIVDAALADLQTNLPGCKIRFIGQRWR